MAAPVSSDDGHLGFQIAPMIDVVFVLMLFFMACIQVDKTRELTVLAPRHGSGGVTIAMLDIAADGSVQLNGEPIGAPQDSRLSGLRNKFHYILEEYGDRDVVMLRPHATVRQERVMEVLSAVQAAGVARVAFL
jgi:biopolymer transport protein ExbD